MTHIQHTNGVCCIRCYSRKFSSRCGVYTIHLIYLMVINNCRRALLVSRPPLHVVIWRKCQLLTALRPESSSFTIVSKMRLSSCKGLQASCSTPKDKRMHIMRTLICIHGFQIHQVTHHMIIFRDPVSAMHIAGLAGNFKRLTTAVALYK